MAIRDGKPCVIVTDDSRVMRKAIIKMLGDGYDIIEAGDGMACWNQVVRDSRIELVVTDIEMPEMDGYSLICRIRAAEDPGLRDLPIIVITGAEDDITRERAYACGANDFILKPIDRTQMISCVNAHIESYEEHPDQDEAASVLAEYEARAGDGTATMPDLESALRILRSPRPEALDEYILNLALRVMPVLDYSNRKFGLELDREILSLKRKILDARGPVSKVIPKAKEAVG